MLDPLHRTAKSKTHRLTDLLHRGKHCIKKENKSTEATLHKRWMYEPSGVRNIRSTPGNWKGFLAAADKGVNVVSSGCP